MLSTEPSPRHTSWTVTRADHTELRDGEGRVIAQTKPGHKLSAVRDAEGQLVVTLRPAVKQIFSARNVLNLAFSSLFDTDGSLNARPGSRPNSPPPLNLMAFPGSVTFASIQPVDHATHTVELLPQGRLNDRAVPRTVGDEMAARLRSDSPLTVTARPDGVCEITDRSGRVFARAAFRNDSDASEPETVEVLDNDLPATWLYAIFLGCRSWTL